MTVLQFLPKKEIFVIQNPGVKWEALQTSMCQRILKDFQEFFTQVSEESF